ncbi:hypothetical protein [Asaccharospora irregularis]|uniref:Uncharacterized protein n=1 Tax=Asaccharospora irregularis DSM 2635 TaxID=1121321 RepID=A0A1M5R276_9FIRM|nr:hypothetical protein [Asaccharospora irregularis]SHH20281.1 hypothetical protein SAMN04488530_12612 [Asaccharospora irregularis DSM 2635]
MEKGCIYCGESKDLSKSDIIPDALTNAKIINPNVCRVEHNNKFSDLFEDEVISKLAIITNELDIKSSKSKRYSSYEVKIKVAGVEYATKISSETELFGSNKKMRSVDGKYLIGQIDEIRKIKAANDTNINVVDINQIEIDKIVKIDLPVFFSQAMYRMVAKIAFEWYCLNNEVNNKINSFEPIIQFITNGTGNDLVTIVSNREVYDLINKTMDFGSHTLLAYVGKDNSVNVLVSLFGMAIYNIRICNSVIDECKNNVLFQNLTLDAKRIQFKFDTFEGFVNNLKDSFIEIEVGNRFTAMMPKDMTDTTLQYQLAYATNYPLFQSYLQCISEPDEKTISLIKKYMEEILQSSAITIRGLKRFVKEHFKSFDEEIILNPKGTNKKAMFMFYLLFIIGQSNGDIRNLLDLNKVLKEKFLGETISISDEVSFRLNDEIFATADYPYIILKGAREIDSWDYE